MHASQKRTFDKCDRFGGGDSDNYRISSRRTIVVRYGQYNGMRSDTPVTLVETHPCSERRTVLLPFVTDNAAVVTTRRSVESHHVALYGGDICSRIGDRNVIDTLHDDVDGLRSGTHRSITDMVTETVTAVVTAVRCIGEFPVCIDRTQSAV
ncbi:hypothetical protein D1872_253030 [compost metagenome]